MINNDNDTPPRVGNTGSCPFKNIRIINACFNQCFGLILFYFYARALSPYLTLANEHFYNLDPSVTRDGTVTFNCIELMQKAMAFCHTSLYSHGPVQGSARGMPQSLVRPSDHGLTHSPPCGCPSRDGPPWTTPIQGSLKPERLVSQRWTVPLVTTSVPLIIRNSYVVFDSASHCDEINCGTVHVISFLRREIMAGPPPHYPLLLTDAQHVRTRAAACNARILPSQPP